MQHCVLAAEECLGGLNESPSEKEGKFFPGLFFTS